MYIYPAFKIESSLPKGWGRLNYSYMNIILLSDFNNIHACINAPHITSVYEEKSLILLKFERIQRSPFYIFLSDFIVIVDYQI